MKVVIYGRPQCKWCDAAKELCDSEGIEYEYINIREAGIDAAKLSQICGTTVDTVPQIFADGAHIGGYDKFAPYVSENEVENPDMDYFVRERGEGDWVKSTFERYMQCKSLYEMDQKKEPKVK